MKRRVAIIIPAFNEEASIAAVVRSVREQEEGYDVIVINDDSNDRTADRAREAGATVINLPFNLGIGGAVQTGFKYALMGDYDACVQVDGDGQHPAELIGSLLKPLFDEGYDLVVGSRFAENTNYKVSLMRGLGIKVLWFFLKTTTGLNVKDPTSGFRAMNKRAIQLFAREYPQDYPEPESLVFAHKHHFRVLEVPTQMRSRMYGNSSIGLLDSGYYMVKVLIAMFIDLFERP